MKQTLNALITSDKLLNNSENFGPWLWQDQESWGITVHGAYQQSNNKVQLKKNVLDIFKLRERENKSDNDVWLNSAFSGGLVSLPWLVEWSVFPDSWNGPSFLIGWKVSRPWLVEWSVFLDWWSDQSSFVLLLLHLLLNLGKHDS